MNPNPEIQKSLRYSIIDGMFWTVMVGCGERFFVPFALMLGASYFDVGMVVALPLLFASLSQLFSSTMIEKINSRKKVVLIGAFLQALLFIPLIFLNFIPISKTILLILLVTAYWVSGSIIAPAWNSWMGDLVDIEGRGSYFGKRNKLMELSTLITFVIAGSFLHIMHQKNFELYGFMILFVIALFARLASWHFLNKKYDPPLPVASEGKLSFFEFVRTIHQTHFGRLVLFLIFMNFSFYVSAPFFTPFMLQDLGFSYFQYMMIVASNMATRLIFMPVWGQVSDRYGARKTLQISVSFLPITVLMWLFSGDYYYIMLIHIISGVVWSGFELSAFTYILDSTSTEKRARCIAYYNVLNGFFIVLGSFLGSQLVKIQIFDMPMLYTAFLGSFILRTLFVLTLFPRIQEIRSVEPISYRKLLTHVITFPILSLREK